MDASTMLQLLVLYVGLVASDPGRVESGPPDLPASPSHSVALQSDALSTAPVLAYSRLLGGSGIDRAWGIAVGENGRAYIAGETTSTDLPEAAKTFGSRSSGRDAFVARLTPSGSLDYLVLLAGASDDVARGVAVDHQGNAYVVGVTASDDFPVNNAYQADKSGETDAFIAKVSSDGRQLIYSTYIGGSRREDSGDIALTSSNEPVIVGVSHSPDFPTRHPIQSIYAGNGDAFVARLASTGNVLIHSSFLGGSGFENGHLGSLLSYGDIEIDAGGNLCITGKTDSRDFPTVNALQPIYGGRADATAFSNTYVTKIAPTGTNILFSSYLGGNQNDVGHDIAVDKDGSVYVTGMTSGKGFPIVNAFQPSMHETHFTSFVTKISADGRSLTYSTFFGGSKIFGNPHRTVIGSAIVVDENGGVYVAGLTDHLDIPTRNAVQTKLNGARAEVTQARDAYLTHFDTQGDLGALSTYLGGATEDHGIDLAVDPKGNIYLTGYTRSQDFPAMGGLFPSTDSSDSNAFIVKFTKTPPPPKLTTRRIASSHILIRIYGPQHQRFSLQGSRDLESWRTIDRGTYHGFHKANFSYQPSNDSTQRFYRVISE